MPAKKNTKTTPVNNAKPEIREKHRKTAIPQIGHTEAEDLLQPSRERNDREKEIDEELVLTFLTEYHAFEQAMVRAGFTRAGRTPASKQPDLGRFARHIEKHFRPDASEMLEGAVAYLLCNPRNQELREERLEKSFPWETSDPQSDVVWLLELVQQTRNRLTLEINFPVTPGMDTTLVMAALFVVEAMANMDPEMESQLTSVL